MYNNDRVIKPCIVVSLIGKKGYVIMFNFKKIARESVSSSPLMCGKALKTADIVGTELTIREVDLISLPNKSGEMRPVGIVTFKEIPESYYLTGRAMTEIIRNWVKAYSKGENFDKDSFEHELTAAGIKVTFTLTTTRSGNTFVLPIFK